MNKLKSLHQKTSLHVKIAMPIAVFFILPLAIALTVKVLTTKNIIFY